MEKGTKKQIFRKKSLERVTSPDQLTDYIRISNPGVWLILAAIVVLLVGICVWGIFGQLDTKLSAALISKKGVAVCYVKESEITSVKEGMNVICGEDHYKVSGIAADPVAVDADFSEYALYVGNYQTGEWVYPVTLDGTQADGVYKAEIIVNSVSPKSFVFN